MGAARRIGRGREPVLLASALAVAVVGGGAAIVGQDDAGTAPSAAGVPAAVVALGATVDRDDPTVEAVGLPGCPWELTAPVEAVDDALVGVGTGHVRTRYTFATGRAGADATSVGCELLGTTGGIYVTVTRGDDLVGREAAGAALPDLPGRSTRRFHGGDALGTCFEESSCTASWAHPDGAVSVSAGVAGRGVEAGDALDALDAAIPPTLEALRARGDG